MATYTVTTSFAEDTTAVASQVNQDFIDVLTALNSFDASNLDSSTAVPLTCITGLTSSQCAASFFKDEDAMTSNSATAVASQQSIKAYVDSITDPSYSGGESHTFEGGLIIKMGISGTVSGSGTLTLTFGTAFPNGILSVQLTRNSSTNYASGNASSVSTTSFVIKNASTSAGTFYWFAVGY